MNKKVLYPILALVLVLSGCGPAVLPAEAIESEVWIDGAIIVSKAAEGLTNVTVSADVDEIWVTPNYTINDETCVTKTASCIFDMDVEFLQVGIWKDDLYGELLIGKADFNKGISFYMIPKYNRFLTEQPVSPTFWRSPDRWQARLSYTGQDEKGDFLMIVAGYPSLVQDIKVYPNQTEEFETEDGYLIRWFERPGGDGTNHWWIEIYK